MKLITVILSLIPLTFKHYNMLFNVIDKVTVTIFIIDYILWITADYKYGKENKCIDTFVICGEY